MHALYIDSSSICFECLSKRDGFNLVIHLYQELNHLLLEYIDTLLLDDTAPSIKKILFAKNQLLTNLDAKAELLFSLKKIDQEYFEDIKCLSLLHRHVLENKNMPIFDNHDILYELERLCFFKK